MKNLRFIGFIAITSLLVIIIVGIEIHYMRLGKIPFTTKLILFVLLNLNLVALLTLIFFVSKSLFKVYLDQKAKKPGHRFTTKLVSVLVVLTLIPSVFLFIVSSGIVTNYLDRWFDPQIKAPLALSVKIAKAVYANQRQQALVFANEIASGGAASQHYSVTHLSKPPDNASETIRSAFEGKPDTEVISSQNGDIIRAAVPRNPQRPADGIIVVEAVMDKTISSLSEEIRTAHQDYRALESWKIPIKTNYLLILGFFTLMIVFSALWVALKMSRAIIEPVQVLAAKTEEVASGNLDIGQIDLRRDDEIGLLINSFNKMVKELKDNRLSLQKAWEVSDRRRLIIENILEHILSGVIFLDSSGTIITINRAACSILKISADELISQNYAVLLNRLESDELRETVRGIRVREFHGLDKELRVKVGDKQILLRILISIISDARGFLGTLVVFDDMTETLRAQKALAWQEVARRIAHEIKNPLTPIQLSTDRMIRKWQNRDQDFSEIFERSTKTIIKEVESLKRLVNEFSRFGKMPEIHKTPCLISSIIEGVVALYHDYKDMDITLTKPAGEPLIDLDAEQFKRVMINIVDNALHAMKNTGRIDIAIHHNPDLRRIFVDIKDNGPGIREEDKEKLFLPYFSTRKDGTGLGLAIASRVIAEHRGYIRIRDNEPTGTVFTIELPEREG